MRNKGPLPFWRYTVGCRWEEDTTQEIVITKRGLFFVHYYSRVAVGEDDEIVGPISQPCGYRRTGQYTLSHILPGDVYPSIGNQEDFPHSSWDEVFDGDSPEDKRTPVPGVQQGQDIFSVSGVPSDFFEECEANSRPTDSKALEKLGADEGGGGEIKDIEEGGMIQVW